MRQASNKNQCLPTRPMGRRMIRLGSMRRGSSRLKPEAGGWEIEAVGRDPPGFSEAPPGLKHRVRLGSGLVQISIGIGKTKSGMMPSRLNQKMNLHQGFREDLLL